MSPQDPEPQTQENQEHDITDLIERIETIEKTLSEIEEKYQSLKAFVDTFVKGITDRVQDCEDSIDAIGGE